MTSQACVEEGVPYSGKDAYPSTPVLRAVVNREWMNRIYQAAICFYRQPPKVEWHGSSNSPRRFGMLSRSD